MADQQEYQALCAGCAKESGTQHGEPEMIDDPEFNGSCQRCGAILAGIFYRMPVSSDTGMLPGPG